MRTDVNTMKNTTLKIWPARSTPATSGNVARMIGAAPRSPTQAISARSRKEYAAHRESQENGDWPANEHQEKGDRKSRRRDRR